MSDRPDRRVPSVADDLRRATTAAVLARPLAARIELALALGDQDAAVFARTAGLDIDHARARLRARRQQGRGPSVVNRSEP